MKLTSSDYIKASKHGINEKTLYHRIYTGWEKERAITQPVQNKSNWISIARSNGIKDSTYMARVYARNWDKERAATEPVKKNQVNREVKR